jgi:DNA-binding CsgD family transcriptional regulator
MHSREIAKKVGLSEFQVLEILTTNFTKLSDKSEIDKQVQNVLEEEQISPRDLKIIQLRKEGLSLDEIGRQTDLTRERVRQIIKKHASDLDFREIRDEVQKRELENYQEENTSIFRNIEANWNEYRSLKFEDLVKIFQVPEWRIRRCISPIQYVYLLANEDQKIPQLWTDEQCIASLQNAATYSFPITVSKYRKLLETGEISGPTPVLFWQRYGSWVQACEQAGVEYGEAQREYNRIWNDTELISFVRKFMHSRADGRWSLENYEEWRRSPEIEGPSVALLRLRLGSWSEIRVIALELHAPEFDMQSFNQLRSDEK